MSAIEASHRSPRSLKREREDEHANLDLTTPLTFSQQHTLQSSTEDDQDKSQQSSDPLRARTAQLPSFQNLLSPKREHSPALSSTSSLTDIRTCSPGGGSVSGATAYSMLNGNGQPPPTKKPKLTFAEKELQAALKLVKQQEKSQAKAEKEMEKQQKEAEKAKRDLEKQQRDAEQKAEREHKRMIRDAENAEKEKARQIREDKKRKKEEEEQKKEDEKRRKEKAQPKLAAFFGVSRVISKEASPVPSASADAAVTPSKIAHKIAEKSDYEKLFSTSFFVKEHVSVAPVNHFAVECSGSNDIEEEMEPYLAKDRTLPIIPYQASELFNCPYLGLTPRGRNIMAVRDIMVRVSGQQGQPIDLTTDSQNTKIKETRKLLSRVPYKTISFSQDVRPPYSGTHTRHSLSELRRLARRPIRQQLIDLNYDYDSEAEWVDGDEEDAEDLMSEMGDEEEDDADHDVEDFIDDEGDSQLMKRSELPANQLPQSTGLCWEDHRHRNPNLLMYGYRMEIMHENISSRTSIDPFSTAYWPSTSSSTKSSMDPPRVPLTMIKNNNPASTPKITKIFGMHDIKHVPASLSVAPSGPSKILISNPDDIRIFREFVDGSEFTRLGLQEILHTKMSKSTKAAVKNSLDAWAQYGTPGAKKKDKKWLLLDSCPQ